MSELLFDVLLLSLLLSDTYYRGNISIKLFPLLPNLLCALGVFGFTCCELGVFVSKARFSKKSGFFDSDFVRFKLAKSFNPKDFELL